MTQNLTTKTEESTGRFRKSNTLKVYDRRGKKLEHSSIDLLYDGQDKLIDDKFTRPSLIVDLLDNLPSNPDYSERFSIRRIDGRDPSKILIPNMKAPMITIDELSGYLAQDYPGMDITNVNKMGFGDLKGMLSRIKSERYAITEAHKLVYGFTNPQRVTYLNFKQNLNVSTNLNVHLNLHDSTKTRNADLIQFKNDFEAGKFNYAPRK